MNETGRLVTIEGIDGAGKSLQTSRVAQLLRADGVRLVVTREPGGGSGGDRIRRLLTGKAAGLYSPETEILLFTAARRNHLDKLVEPAMAEGKLVLCDRFADSTRVYQGFERPQMRTLIDELHQSVIGLEPDLTLVLDLPVEVAIQRIRNRDGSDQRFEQLGSKVTALRDGFRRLVQEFPNRCRLLEGTRSQDEITDEIYQLVRALVA